VSSQVVASQSVLQSKQPVAADGIVYVLSGGTFTGDHLTLRGNGTARGVLVDSTSVGVTNDSTVTLKNSIISNVAVASLSSEAGASLTTSYTMIPSVLTTMNTGSAAQETGTVIGSPIFSNAAAGDFRLTAPQTAIDAGDPADVTTLDRASNPRIVNGDSVAAARSDLGAYEYQAAAPVVTISAPAKLGQGVAGSFSATATDSDPGDSISLAWNFGDGTATGANASHAFATLGTKTVTVTATDQIGRSSTATANVSVVDEIAPALKITGVKLNKKRTALGASIACPATETTCKVSYKLTSSKKLKVGKSKKKIITLAKAGSANVAGGRTAKLQIKLNKTALALLAKSSVRVKLFITLTDGAQNSAKKTVTYTAKQGKTGSAKK
jgi:PKD repeat protein